MNSARVILFLFICSAAMVVKGQQIVIKGKVMERDSVTVMPFVYIIKKSNGNGTMTDNEGKFTLVSNANDTLICSYVGHARRHIPVKSLVPDKNGDVKIVMIQMLVNLNDVTITAFKFKPYEREYMNEIIEKSKIKTLDYISSPISALYMHYSKEGRQIRKLAKIFEDLMIEEQVQKKLSREILVNLTKDENIDYEAFRKYCYYVNDYYIISHDGVELYSKVMDCYRKWKTERVKH